MAEKEYLFKLLYRAFLDIRIASYSKESQTCFVLADIFHTVPLQMNQADKGEKSYADIVIWDAIPNVGSSSENLHRAGTA